MAKVRVYELAKELGVESKTVLSMLKDMGEFVRSASSTVEAPVERRLKEKLASEPPPVKKAPAKKAAAKKADGEQATSATAAAERACGGAGGDRAHRTTVPSTSRACHAGSASDVSATGCADQRPQPTGPQPTRPQPAAVPRPGVPRAPGQAAPAARTSEQPTTAPRPRPGSTGGLPGAPGGRRPGTPRPGNNPFAPSQGMGRSRPAASRPRRHWTCWSAPA